VQLSAEQINWLNIVLMLAATVAAFLLPLHLFLVAYAILGPLHYLTEISWLHDREYFFPGRGRAAWLVLVAATMAVLLYGFVMNDLLRRPVAPALEIGMVYLAFATALLLPLVQRAATAAVLVVSATAAIAWFSGTRTYFILAYFLVTIIHVLLFTAAFVLFGALKSKSRAAIISFAVLAACAASFFIYTPAAAPPPEWLRAIYSRFEPLNEQLMRLFGAGAAPVMRLIAFAYTYHYLNWFSKTSIIKWHDVSRRRALVIGALWLASVALYAHNYALGFSILYLLSLLHVLLEFPLDHKTFAGIAKELRARA
jgi:hypothetical protein